MIILSASMPKSGSAWYFNLTNDLLIQAGFDDTRHIREKYSLHSILKYDECNIQKPTLEKLSWLTSTPIDKHTFVVKTHFSPDRVVLNFISKGLIKPTYIYRDPRDIAVSLFDAGKMLRERGIHERAAEIMTIKEAILKSKKLIRNSWNKWRKIKGVLLVRYEDLLTHTSSELERLCTYLNINVDTDKIDKIIQKWDKNKLKQGKLHFYKGTIGRYREFMGSDELDFCYKKVGKYLKKMGYSE